MYAQLGDIVFEALIGFESFQIESEVAYAEHAKINRRPRLQMTGVGLREITGSIGFHNQFCVPEQEIGRFGDYMNQATVLPLILGTGKHIGDFVITKLSEVVGQTDALGSYISAKLSVTLKEYYVEDKLTQKQQDAQGNAVALSGNDPVPVRGQLKSHMTDQGQISVNMVYVKAEAGQTDKFVKDIEKDPSLASVYGKKISNSLGVIGAALGNINGILTGNITLTTLATGLPGAAGSAMNAVANMSGQIPIVSITNITNLNTLLQGAIGNVNVAAAPITAKTIFRRP